MDNITLFHGSRGGIKGDIKPQSREHCDFGRGFYLGEFSEQAKGLIRADSNPFLYTMTLKLSEIPEDRILILDGLDWVYAVLANRQSVPEFNQLQYAKDWINFLNDHDVIVGPIADDKMADAMREFQKGTLTTDGLLYCLQHVQYGMQYVCKTEEACRHIDVLSSRELTDQEIEEADIYSLAKRRESNGIIGRAIREFRNKGMYIDQLIETIKQRENIEKIQTDNNEIEHTSNADDIEQTD